MKKILLMVVLVFTIIFAIGCTNTSAKIKINKTKLTLKVGQTYKLKVKGTKKKVKWTSSKKSIATVSKKGKVKAKKKGTVTIKAKVGKKTFKCKLKVTKKKTSSNSSNSSSKESIIIAKINGKIIPITWKDNESVKALIELVKQKPLEIKMSKYGGFEQVGDIGKSLPSNDKNITTKAGDIVLYDGDQIVMFYGSNTWDYTRLGTINMSEKELKDLLGNSNVILVLELK